MKKTYVVGLLAVTAILARSQNASAVLLAGWDFAGLPNGTNGTPAIIASTVGAASLDVSTFGLGGPVQG